MQRNLQVMRLLDGAPTLASLATHLPGRRVELWAPLIALTNIPQWIIIYYSCSAARLGWLISGGKNKASNDGNTATARVRFQKQRWQHCDYEGSLPAASLCSRSPGLPILPRENIIGISNRQQRMSWIEATHHETNNLYLIKLVSKLVLNSVYNMQGILIT